MKVLVLALGLILVSGASALDIGLEQALERAVQHAPDVLAQKYQLQAAIAKAGLSYRRYLPSVSVQNNASQSVRWNQDDTESVSWSATVRQPLFLGVADLYTKDLTDQDLSLAQVAVRGAEEAARDACWQAFQSYLLERAKLSVTQGLQSLAEEQLKVTVKERELGSAREIDLLETAIESKRVLQQVRSQQEAVRKADYALKGLLGLDVTTVVEWKGEFSGAGYQWPAGWSVEALRTRALALNLDLQKARGQIQKLQVQRQSAELDIVPTLDVEGSYSLTGAGYPLDKQGYSFKLNARLPFRWLPVQLSIGYTNNPGADFGKSAQGQGSLADDIGFLVDVETLQFQLDAAVLSEAQMRKDVAFAIESQVRDLQLQADALLLQGELIELSEKKAVVLKKQVELGEAKRVDYLKAETDLVNQRLSTLEQEKQILLAERQLEKTAGLPLGTLPAARSRS